MKKKSNNIIISIFSILLGVGIGIYSWSFINHAKVQYPKVPFFLLFIIYIVLTFFSHQFNIIIHETGHMLFGFLSGYHFNSFRIGSHIWIKNSSNKLVHKKYSLANTGGQCLMIPPDTTDYNYPISLYLLGGVLLNFIFFVFYIILLFIIKSNIIKDILILLIITDVECLFLNGIPMRVGYIDNDAKNIVLLKKNKDRKRAIWIELKIVRELSLEKSYSEMNDDWFKVTEAYLFEPTLVNLFLYKSNRLIEEEKIEEALEILEKLVNEDSALIPLQQKLVYIDIYTIYLLKQKNCDAILDEILAKDTQLLYKQMQKFPSVIRLEYALSLFNKNDESRAKEAIKKFKAIEKTYPYLIEIEQEKTWIRKLFNEYNKQKENN